MSIRHKNLLRTRRISYTIDGHNGQYFEERISLQIMAEQCWYHPDREAFLQCDTCERFACEEDFKMTNKLVLDQEFIPHKSETIGYSLCPICDLDRQIDYYGFSFFAIVSKILILFVEGLFFVAMFGFENPINIVIFGGGMLALIVFTFYKSFISPRIKVNEFREQRAAIINDPSSI